MSEFNQSLHILDIAIRFLTTVGGNKDMTIHDFLTEVLKMNCDGLGKAAQKCKLCHMQSLWIMLAHERAKLLTAAEQVCFLLFSSILLHVINLYLCFDIGCWLIILRSTLASWERCI